MSTCCGVSDAEPLHHTSSAATLRRRGSLGWLLPTGILALVPKCPACIAAYVAVCSGFGISISTASAMRTAVIATCVASMTYFAARQLNRASGWKQFRRIAAAAPIL